MSCNSTFIEKYIENVSTTLGKVNCLAKIHYCMAIYQTYIISYCSMITDFSNLLKFYNFQFF